MPKLYNPHLRPLLTSLVLALCVGCGARSVEPLESNTNWLKGCDTSSECADGMACECGVCTANCADQACPSQLTCLAECGNGGSCQKACEQDFDCEHLASNAQCQDGVCRVSGGLSYSAVDQPDVTSGEPSAPSSDAPGTSSEPNGTGADAACRVAYVEYAAGTSVYSDGCGDASCLCDESGELVDCVGTGKVCAFAGHGPIKPCDELFPGQTVPSDLYTLQSAFIDGGVLTLHVGHSAGCSQHDYGLCYRSVTGSQEPNERELVFIHDSHGETCEAWGEATLAFDLAPMGQRYLEENDVPGGVIPTQFGVYGFGELSCELREEGANVALQQATDALSLTCENDEDCTVVYPSTDCFARCGLAIAREDQTALDEALTRIDQNLCVGFEEAGCGPVLVPPCDPETIHCFDGQCRFGDLLP